MFSFEALSLTSPAILIALLTLPAIWLLLRASPPPPQRKPFPAFDILRRLQDTAQQADNTPWYLLLLRLMIAALIIFGLSGPILNAPQADNESSGRPIIAIVDTSWPAAENWPARRDILLQIAEEVRRSGRGAYLMATTQVEASNADTPMSPSAFENASKALDPSALKPDLAAVAELVENLPVIPGGYDIRWLSDGLMYPQTETFQNRLTEHGTLTIYLDRDSDIFAVHSPVRHQSGMEYRVTRLRTARAASTRLIATARDGREIFREPLSLAAGEATARLELNLPAALRNEIAAIRLQNPRSAGATYLVDGRERHSLVGLLDRGLASSENLLSGAYYIEKALEPNADLFTDDIPGLVTSDATAIILDDIGTLRPEDTNALTAWIENGGVLIRFAGDTMAQSAQENTLALLPTTLRGGGRAFGGALSWETPQQLGPFSPTGPFANLSQPKEDDEIYVRRQVLAAPGGETSARTWASLADGTPLVTGTRVGDGAIVLFHITANPAWSDLPLSSLFVDMLKEAILLSALGNSGTNADNGVKTFTPIAFLDGFGALSRVPDNARSITAAQAANGASPAQIPGLYGAPDAPIAINAVTPGETFTPLSPKTGRVLSYAAAPPRRLGPPLFLMAMILLITDALVSWWLAGGWRAPSPISSKPASSAQKARLSGQKVTAIRTGRLNMAFLAMAALGASMVTAPRARAQTPEVPLPPPLDQAIDDATQEASLQTRLAYVPSGDPRIDEIIERGLIAISEELTRRTAVEPGPPRAVDPARDELSVYPLIYWPVISGSAPPSPEALANIEVYMRFGGLIIFDTRDDERAIPGTTTPARAALQDILRGIDIPPRHPLPDGHVLTRSFYLLTDLTGRQSGGPVWVQASGNSNDAVTPLIITGRDWAGAWARDHLQQPLLRPNRAAPACSVRPGIAPQECAYRAGVNIVMVALTGNYKSDQVHTPILLNRLGRE